MVRKPRPRVQLTDDQRVAIGMAVIAGKMTQAQLARMYGIADSTVFRCKEWVCKNRPELVPDDYLTDWLEYQESKKAPKTIEIEAVEPAETSSVTDEAASITEELLVQWQDEQDKAKAELECYQSGEQTSMFDNVYVSALLTELEGQVKQLRAEVKRLEGRLNSSYVHSSYEEYVADIPRTGWLKDHGFVMSVNKMSDGQLKYAVSAMREDRDQFDFSSPLWLDDERACVDELISRGVWNTGGRR